MVQWYNDTISILRFLSAEVGIYVKVNENLGDWSKESGREISGDLSTTLEVTERGQNKSKMNFLK